MEFSLREAAKTLADAKAGWVHRRDAANALGDMAARALAALRDCARDGDVDVRTAVAHALAKAKAGFAGVAPPPETGYTLEGIARACERSGKRTVREDKDGFAIEVSLKDGRRQTVYLRSLARDGDETLIRLYSFCARAPDAEVIAWAMRANAQLGHSALAVVPAEDGERLALVRCFSPKDATPDRVRAALKEIAYYGDWLERKLTGSDEF